MVFETRNQPETRSTQRVPPPEHPDRIHVAFDDYRRVANAGLLLPVALARHLGLVDRHVDLDHAPGQANAGDKMQILPELLLRLHPLPMLLRRWMEVSHRHG